MKALPDLPNVLNKTVCDFAFYKWLGACILAIGEYVLPGSALKETALGAVAILLLDTLTGTFASLKSGEAISSAKFGRVAVKILGYSSVIAVASIAGQTLPGMKEYHQAGLMGVFGLIIVTEGISVLENVQKMGVKSEVVQTVLDRFFQARGE